MKNKFALLFFAVISLTYACGTADQEKSTEVKESKTEEVTQKYTLSPERTLLTFTAFKTTDKVPVKGEFETVEFEERSGNDVEALLNGLEFSIPVSSLFTNDATNTRDPKIIEFFFGVMSNTEMLSGTIHSQNGAYSANLKMNGVTQPMQLDVNVTDEKVLVARGALNLSQWDALAALASLNEACFDLHKGPDGESKTWEVVEIEITAKLLK